MIPFWLWRNKRDKSPVVQVCEVCTEAISEETETVVCSRGHKFCVSCFRMYAEEVILGMSKITLPCMAPKCSEKYPENVTERWLSKELLEKLRQNGFQWTEGLGKRNMTHLTEEDRKRIEREERLTNEAIRRCPKCKKAIVKAGGCNHVICPSCETHLCYSCGIGVKASDYTHVCRNWNDWQQAAPNFVRLSIDTTEMFRYRRSIPVASALAPSESIIWRETTSVEMRLKEAVQLTRLFQGSAWTNQDK